MDFVVRFPRIVEGYNVIWVIVDRLTKSAYFTPIKLIFSTERLAEIFVASIFRLRGVPLSIISDRDAQLT